MKDALDVAHKHGWDKQHRVATSQTKTSEKPTKATTQEPTANTASMP